jgi:hypothetical protein
MVRLTRLRVDRFRNVKPGTELRFGPTFNVLLGKNATGKSTLLDLVAAVTNDDLSAYAGEDAGFDLTWWLEEGEHEMERRAERTPVISSALPEGVREEEEKEFDDFWTMVLRIAGTETGRFEMTGTRGVWRAAGEPEVPFDVRSGLATERAGRRVVMAALLSKPSEYSDQVARVVLSHRALVMLDPRGQVGRFDEALGALDAITRSSFELSRGGGATGSLGPWLPWDFFLAANEQTAPDPTVSSFEKLESLAKVPALLGFASAELRTRVLQRSQHGQRVTTTYGGFDCLFRRADGSQISHQLLSFGQKRLFSFLWYLAVRENLPVVADELLNGLHHEWIEVCFQRLQARQSFLATQHPLLLDHIPIVSAEAVRTTFVRCTRELGSDGREQMVWRNFNEEEAERFFIAYQTGIQQVSEVLRSEGLW